MGGEGLHEPAMVIGCCSRYDPVAASWRCCKLQKICLEAEGLLYQRRHSNAWCYWMYLRLPLRRWQRSEAIRQSIYVLSANVSDDLGLCGAGQFVEEGLRVWHMVGLLEEWPLKNNYCLR